MKPSRTDHPLSRAGNSPNRASLRSRVLNTYERTLLKFMRAIRRGSEKRCTNEQALAAFEEADKVVKADTLIYRAPSFPVSK